MWKKIFNLDRTAAVCAVQNLDVMVYGIRSVLTGTAVRERVACVVLCAPASTAES